MTAQMTEWYPPEIKPVRAGVYHTLTERCMCAAIWTGIEWITTSARTMPTQHLHWRGLTADPAVTK